MIMDMQLALRRGVQALRRLGDVSSIAQSAAALIRDVTGYERVMIYRFDSDWNGEVLAESCAAGVDAYLGLHFPASDIPEQARDLLKESGVRLIPDVLRPPSRLLA
jgi:light-regulated signal transduction histidine kinase (bacteriophytochrome)